MRTLIHVCFVEECLRDTNLLRRLHENTDPVEWSDRLSKQAQRWTNYIGFFSIKIDTLKGKISSPKLHSSFYKMTGSKKGTCANALLQWYVIQIIEISAESFYN